MGTPHNLPLQLTSFVGRAQAQAELSGLLANSRLLTLTGPGGAGKTRLALRVAGDLVGNFDDGVWLVELASLPDGELLCQAVATVLEIPERPRSSLIDTVSDALETRRLLLVLDNCEHLIEAAASLVAHLLRACPEMHVLCTSREALNIDGETVWRVPPLSLRAPGASESGESEAVQLFLERAQAVQPSFAASGANADAVVDICRHLDGMPLAIELAAARVRVLSPEQIAARLHDRFRLLSRGSRSAPTRHQTLHATIDWSYALLTQQEQRLFDRVSVFAGGWTLEAAEQVCAGEHLEPEAVLDLLAALVDKSLVLAEPTDGVVRYRLLETLRQYGHERLGERGEANDVAQRHAEFVVAFAELTEGDFRGSRELEALNRLEAEHDNARSALGWLIATGDAGHGLRLGAVLGLFWFWQSHLTEGRQWLEQLLAVPCGGDFAGSRAKCLFAAGLLAMARADYETAQAQTEESLALWGQLGDRWWEAALLQNRGMLLRVRGERAAADRVLWEAVAACRSTGNRYYEAWCRMRLAEIALLADDLAMARARAEEARALAAEVGAARQLFVTLVLLADVCFEQREDTAALAFAEESAAGMRSQGLTAWWLAQPLLSLGKIATARRDFVRAQTTLSEGLELCRRLGDKSGIAVGLQGFAYLAAARRQSRRAVRLAAAADNLWSSIGGTERSASKRVQRELVLIGQSLEPDIYEAAYAAAKVSSLQAVIDYALVDDENEDKSREAERASPTDALTPREREVAALVAEGLTNREIAERLVLTEKTAANHVARVFDKLGIHSRAQLAARALDLGVRDKAPTS